MRRPALLLALLLLAAVCKGDDDSTEVSKVRMGRVPAGRCETRGQLRRTLPRQPSALDSGCSRTECRCRQRPGQHGLASFLGRRRGDTWRARGAVGGAAAYTS